MSSVLQQIMELVAPPMNPVGLDRSWQSVEEDIGVVLPADYKGFIDEYGSGLVCNLVAIWNLRDSSLFEEPLLDTLCGGESLIEAYRDAEMFSAGDWVPFPEVGGLLPFANVIDVHGLNWKTDGDANEWDVVFWFSDGHEFIHLKGDSFSDFLLKMLKNEYDRNEILRFDGPYQFTDMSNW